MKKIPVETNRAPAAIGPYSQGIRTDGLMFFSGQIPLDPATGKLVSGGIEEQTKRVLDNIQALLEASGVSFQNVVKTTIFLTDLKNFSKVNEIYASYFKAPFPARSTIQVAGLPLGSDVEIEVIVSA